MMNLTEDERRKFVALFIPLVKMIRSNDLKSFEKLRGIVPLFRLDATYRVDGSTSCREAHRSFTYLTNKDKGKKRVYVSNDGSHDMFIHFVSRNLVRKLCHDSDILTEWAVDYFGDRWTITTDSHEFNNLFQLMNHIVAIEDRSSKSNRPPIGQSPHVWKNAENVIREVSRYRSIKSGVHTYAVNLKSYDFIGGSHNVQRT